MHEESIFYACEKCEYTSRDSKALDIHKSQSHKEMPAKTSIPTKSQAESNAQNKPTTYQCDDCPNGYKNWKELSFHMKLNT